MPNENAQRRLISILAADVVEYSRMMEADEAGTMAALKSRRDEILKPLVAKHHGRVFKLLGDGVLVEFFSAVNAVQCAIELQGAFATANADVAENQRILLRIGINLGDVMVEGGDLYGDGVNVASRLENLAEPGGIVISGPVHDFIKNKVNCQFADLGAQSLKNISTPVQAYKISGTPLGPVPAQPVHGAKPSIAVLAFVNMSGDPDQDYFADGLAEDIITALSRFSNLTVIARTSSFIYKGQNIDTKRAANELGCDYIMEGSVRRAGGRLRVTAQLIAGKTGHHVWAERFDRPAGDIFDIQDEIMRSVAASTDTQIQLNEHRLLAARMIAEPRATDLVSRAWGRIYDFAPEAFAEAAEMAERAIQLEPGNPRAHIVRARVHLNRLWFGLIEHSDENLASGLHFAQTAVRLAAFDEWAYFCLSYAYELLGRPYEAVAAAARSIELNPNFSNGYSEYGRSLAILGQTLEAIAACDTALKLNPRDPTNWERHSSLAIAHFATGDFEAAAREARSAIHACPQLPEAMIILTGACAAAGSIEEARKITSQIVQHWPKIRIGNFAPGYFPGYARQDDQQRLLSMLRLAGLPE